MAYRLGHWGDKRRSFLSDLGPHVGGHSIWRESGTPRVFETQNLAAGLGADILQAERGRGGGLGCHRGVNAPSAKVAAGTYSWSIEAIAGAA
jgi:hypothetical protein